MTPEEQKKVWWILSVLMVAMMMASLDQMIFGTALRATGDTKTPMVISTIMNVVNVVLNFLLIYATREITILGFTFTMYGAGLGVTGAAIASAISFAVCRQPSTWATRFSFSSAVTTCSSSSIGKWL